MPLDKKLKEAISQLSSAEKDKLIFRFLNRNEDLAERLYFELVSNDSEEDRRKEAKKRIEKIIDMSKISIHSPGFLLMDMREASGTITHHTKITKDKYGEVYLNIFLLQEYLKIYNEFFKDYSAKKSYTFSVYCTAKAFKIMILLKKMHEDLQFDFINDISAIGNLFCDSPVLMEEATHHGLNVDWLIKNEIPANIDKIEKDLRQNGFLK